MHKPPVLEVRISKFPENVLKKLGQVHGWNARLSNAKNRGVT